MNIMHTEMWREVSIKVVNDCFTFNKTKDWGLYLIVLSLKQFLNYPEYGLAVPKFGIYSYKCLTQRYVLTVCRKFNNKQIDGRQQC